MKSLLVILFVMNGHPTIINDGWAPIEVDATVCEQRAERVAEYINTIDGVPELHGVYCGTQEELQERFDIIINSVPA